MLAEIFANFLRVTSEEAAVLIRILTREKRWHENQVWKDITIDPKNIKTQLDLIKFLQCIGQSHWFKGFDRTKLPDNPGEAEVLDQYYDLFKGFGLIDEISYQSQHSPDVAVILGSSCQQIKTRLETLEKDMRAGIVPSSNLIVGAAGNRLLTEATDGKVAIEYLKDKGYLGDAINEMTLVTELTKEILVRLQTESPALFGKLEYKPAYSPSDVKDRSPGCVTTKDNGEATNKILANDPRFQVESRKLQIVIYSKQPFGRRQLYDFGQYFDSSKYDVHVRANNLSKVEFQQHPRSIAVGLKEIAATANMQYTTLDLGKFDVPLIDAELAELGTLTQQPAADLVAKFGAIYHSPEEASVSSGNQPATQSLHRPNAL